MKIKLYEISNTPKWFVFWIFWSFAFAVWAFFSMITRDHTILHMSCFLLQSACGIFWLTKYAEAKKRIDKEKAEKKAEEEAKQAMKEVVETLG